MGGHARLGGLRLALRLPLLFRPRVSEGFSAEALVGLARNAPLRAYLILSWKYDLSTLAYCFVGSICKGSFGRSEVIFFSSPAIRFCRSPKSLSSFKSVFSEIWET